MRSDDRALAVDVSRPELIRASGEQGKHAHRLKVAYIMSRFPKLTETFILYEMLAMQEQGVQVEVFPLLRERTDVIHPEAASFVEKAHYQPFLSLAIFKANLHFLWHKPRVYLQTLWTLMRANWGSPGFFVGALGIFPKTVLFAYQMRAEKISHVHAHFASHPAAAAFIIRRLVGIPYGFTAHGSDLHRDRHMLCEKVAEAKYVAPISEYNRKMIVEECNNQFADKVTVVHCGVNTGFFQARTEKTPFERGENPFMILCVGTLHEVKGQIYLIEACGKLHERGMDFICHFVGDGEDQTLLVKTVNEMGLADKFRFHGRLTQSAIARLLGDADVLTAPSVPTRDGRREGIPVVLMEAMSSGVPVIASNISGIPELVQDGITGLLVPPRDASSLADALERYWANHHLRQRLGSAGREKVVADFDLFKNAAKLAQHFIKKG